MTTNLALRHVAVHVEGEDAPRSLSAILANDGTVDLVSFGDDAGWYEFVDVALLGGVDYVALYRRTGEPQDYVAQVEALDDALDPPSPPHADPASLGTIRGDTYIDAPDGIEAYQLTT